MSIKAIADVPAAGSGAAISIDNISANYIVNFVCFASDGVTTTQINSSITVPLSSIFKKGDTLIREGIAAAVASTAAVQEVVYDGTNYYATGTGLLNL